MSLREEITETVHEVIGSVVRPVVSQALADKVMETLANRLDQIDPVEVALGGLAYVQQELLGEED